ncbi:hypothetical protein EDD28_3247 [Salana multivorans]|uniref:Uncharacterized protein n=1 Tax=Salana multivorans TaxID=120377 RepID=A0A3N2D225_9MICO|nr:hypothetical protein [Salana multivorans]ROR93819.1 hypothetical protein EDD28_3247 [Salana multivorans]
MTASPPDDPTGSGDLPELPGWPDDIVVPDDLSALFADETDGDGGDAARPTGTPDPAPGSATADPVDPAPGSAAAAADGDPADPAADAEPVVRTTAVVLTRVKQAKVLAGLMALAGIDAAVVPSTRGAIAVRYVEQDAADVGPAEALSGIPVEAEALGAALSVATRAETVLLAARVNDVDGEITGQVRARAYRGGQIVQEPPPGLVLAGADAVAERLLIGVVQAPEVAGYISSTDLGSSGSPRPGRSFFGRRRRGEEEA